MQAGIQRVRLGVVAVAAVLFVWAGTAQAADPKSKQIETEAEFVSYDAAAKAITVKVRKPGKAPENKALKLRNGEEAKFNVKPEGSVLVRTTVKLQNGTAGSFDDLEAGRKVRVFWIEDPADKKARQARSISVFVPAEEQGEDAE